MEKGSMNIIKRIGLLLFYILLTSCGSKTPGLVELKELCEKDAGLTIYKTVEADGYYDATGSNLSVAETAYQFIEFCDDNPTFIDSIPEPGCWRVSKVKRDSGQCYDRLDKKLKKIVVDPYPEFLKTHCIAVEKLDKPTARYRYEVERKVGWLNESASTKMTSNTGRIVNNKTGEILGERKNYILRPKNSNPPSFHCGSPQITGLQKSIPFATGLIEKALTPRTDESLGEVK
jgi:hypothetical protein